MTYLELLHSGSGAINQSRYVDAEFDRLVDAARNTSDLAERARLMLEAETYGLARVGVAVIATEQDRRRCCLTLRLNTDPRTLVDLSISGHNTTIASVSIRMPASQMSFDDEQIDPLEKFADPLGRYG